MKLGTLVKSNLLSLSSLGVHLKYSILNRPALLAGLAEVSCTDQFSQPTNIHIATVENVNVPKIMKK